MPRSASETRQAILHAAFKEFRRKGYFRSGVDEIAAASRVTKRTLYNHFPSKDDLLAAVLVSQHERDFLMGDPYGIRPDGDPHHFIDELFEKLIAWSSTPRWAGAGFTRLAMELADLPGHPARVIAKRHKLALEDYLTGVLERSGVENTTEQARRLMVLLEGTMLLIVIHGDRSYAKAAATAAKQLITLESKKTKRILGKT
jgi:AcrR family transcriptional regulator